MRGEDSALRAQWARRPFLWQLYPQQEGAHFDKLAAFLGLYGEGMAPQTAALVRQFAQAWNGDATARLDWPALVAALPALHDHGQRWQRQLAAQPDLASALIEFAGKIG